MHWKVSATLSSPLMGDAPYLDAILEFEMAQRLGLAKDIQRSEKAPEPGAIHIPCLRGKFGGVDHIPRCSAPILSPGIERVEHYAKRLAVEHSSLLAHDERKSVAIGNQTYKSYRLPSRVRQCNRVVWFVGGSKRRHLKSLLDSVHSIGKKRSQGYGRIAEWQFEEVEHDWSWFAKIDGGTLLMRVLPKCGELSHDLIGFKEWFGGAIPPYWHPDRFCEVVVPC